MSPTSPVLIAQATSATSQAPESFQASSDASSAASSDVASSAASDTAAPVAGVIDSAATGGVMLGEPNWWVILGLVYLGCAIIGFAATYIGGCQWQASAPARRAWAARHQVHGTGFAALLALLGLTGLAVAQFRSVASPGPEILLGFMSLTVLGLVYLFTIDLFETDDGDLDRDAAPWDSLIPAATPKGSARHSGAEPQPLAGSPRDQKPAAMSPAAAAAHLSVQSAGT